MNVQNDICRAIAGHNQVTFYYDGGHRTVEPHMVAYLKTTGALTLSAWFLTGTSKSGSGQGWRQYSLSKIEHLTVDANTFAGPRPDYQSDGGKVFRDVVCALP